MDDFENLLRALISPDNQARGQAEQALHNVLSSNPGMLLSCLGQTVRVSADPILRSTASVLLRRYSSDLFNNPKTGQDEKALAKASLLGSIQEEPDKSIRRKVADTTGAVAFTVMNSREGSQWPELVPFLIQYCTSATAAHRESVLRILGSLAEWLGGTLVAMAEDLKVIFGTGLADQSDGAVRLAALEATCKFLPALPDRAVFGSLLAPMVQVVTGALTDNDEFSARAALEHLISLVDSNVNFLRDRINDIAEMALTICGSEGLDEGTRHLGMEFLVSVAEKSPGLARKMRMADKIIPVCMQFMLTIEEDDGWEQNDDDEQDEEVDTYNVGEETLYRVSMSIGGNAVIPVLTEILAVYVENPDWRYRLAALSSISQTTEGCSKQLATNLSAVVELVLSRFSDPHPRVRHAALNTLGTMASDFGPTLQEQFHAPVMTGLATLMQESSARVQAHAAAALCNFCDCDEETREGRAEVMAPYLDGVLSKLQSLLTSDRKIVLDNAIVAVAAVASVVEEKFAPYYDMFMPFLKQVVSTATADAFRMVRAKAIECISLVGLAVGKEKFTPDALGVMEMMAGTQMKSDDPQAEYIVNAWPRICKCLGAGFVPYLQYVMPSLLESAAKKPDVAFQDADQGEMEGMENLQIGDKIIGIRTSDMEEKKNAAMAIARFVEYLQEHFYPYIEKTATIMIPLLKFYYHDDVRLAGAFAMPELVKCCFKYHEANGGDHTSTTQLTHVIYSNLVQCIPDEPQVEVQVAMLEALQETIEASARCLGADQAPAFLEMVPKVWQELEERHAEQVANTNEDCDAEEWAAIQEQNSSNDEVHEYIGHCLGTFFKAHKDAFLPFFMPSGLPQQLMAMLKSSSDIHRKAAMWVWTDMVDNCPSTATASIEQIIPPMLSYATMERPATVRTAAAYGLGVCAAQLGPAMAPFCCDIVAKLVGLVNHPESRVDDNEDATDNVVSALGKICLHQSQFVDVSTLFPIWLAYLPLKADLEEAAVCNDQLCTLLDRHALTNFNAEQLVKLATVMAVGLREKHHTTPAVASKMQMHLDQIKGALPKEALPVSV